MWPSIQNDVPVLCVDNYYDYHRDFLDRCDTLNDTKAAFQKNSCARFICYGGEPKLVVSPSGTVLLNYFKAYLSFEDELIVLPNSLTGSTVEKLMSSLETIERIKNFSSPQHKLQMMSWASTNEIRELAHYLETHHDLEITLVEAPSDDHYWTQQYLDKKSGFREITSTIFNQGDRILPEGFTCLTDDEVADSARWFLSRNKDCIIKPNKGCLGKGIIKLEVAQNWSKRHIKEIFNRQKNLFLNEPAIVEEKISSPDAISPSVEFYIPPLGKSSPEHTYLVKQYLDGDFSFIGNIISKELEQEPWHDLLMKNAYRLAARVQQLGYVGYMDIDCIVDEHQNPYFVEVNPRRTGGTHYHEMALRLFGEDYLEKISLISNSHLHSHAFRTFEELFHGSRDLLYNPGGIERGIIISEANLLASHGIVSVASIGRDIKEAAHYLSLFQERIGSKDTI